MSDGAFFSPALGLQILQMRPMPCRAGTMHPCCALSEFLTHRVCKHNTRFFYTTKFGIIFNQAIDKQYSQPCLSMPGSVLGLLCKRVIDRRHSWALWSEGRDLELGPTCWKLEMGFLAGEGLSHHLPYLEEGAGRGLGSGVQWPCAPPFLSPLHYFHDLDKPVHSSEPQMGIIVSLQDACAD